MPVAPAASWDGILYGGHIGVGFGDLLDPTTVTAAFDATSLSTSAPSENAAGFVSGAHITYNIQRGSLVYGVEADLSRTNIAADSAVVTAAVPGPGGQDRNFVGGDAAASIDWYGTFRARVGTAINDLYMIYATVGLAYGKVDLHGAVGAGGQNGGGPAGRFNALSGFHNSSIRIGWVVGAGIEYQTDVWNNAIVSLAYQYVDLGNVSATRTVIVPPGAGTATGTISARADAAFHVVRVGASWHFGENPLGAYAAATNRAPMYSNNWAGFYVGAHTGGIWTADNLIDPPLVSAAFTGAGSVSGTAGGVSDSSLLFGTHAGYNFQRGTMVYGVELDGAVMNLRGATGIATARIDPGGQPDVRVAGEAGASVGWLSTLRGRFGYAMDRTLVYGTAGIAVGKVNFHGDVNVGGSVGGGPPENLGQYARFSDSSVEFGWVAGAGFDYKIVPDMLLSLAYLYVDLGNISNSAVATIANAGSTGTGTVSANADLAFHVFRVGLTWQK